MEYYGIMPERKIWVKTAAVLIGVYAVYSAIINHNWFYMPFGVVIILATFSDRKHVISTDGVDILYTLCGIPFHNTWKWDEIKTIHTDSIKSRPNIELHIGKDVTTRRFIFKESDAMLAIEMGRNMNPGIYVAEIKHK